MNIKAAFSQVLNNQKQDWKAEKSSVPLQNTFVKLFVRSSPVLDPQQASQSRYQGICTGKLAHEYNLVFKHSVEWRLRPFQISKIFIWTSTCVIGPCEM